MPFKKGDRNINRAGRRRGARNKKDPEKEIQSAFAAGMTLAEIIDVLSEKVRNRANPKEEMSDATLIKYIAKLLDIKMSLAKEYMQIMKDAEEASKPQAPKQEEHRQPQQATVTPITFSTKAKG